MKYLLSTLLLTLFSAVSFAQDNLNIQLLKRVAYDVPLNDIWGYSDGDNEFALVGTYDGVSIVDVTDPLKPVEKSYISTVSSVWKDIKTYSHYAYITHGIYSSSDTPTGLLIVDLNTLDQDNPKTFRFNAGGLLETAHNLFIDEEGFAYLFGVNENGGALILNLQDDPENPSIVSNYTGHYLHDGFVKENKLYGCADKNGYFVIIDVADKFNPKDIVTSDTPNRTTHSAWMSEDGKTLFTTDERESAYITAFDVSNPDNISQLDVIRTSKSEQSIPHNTLVKGDYLVSSYYAQGIQIVDASNPKNLVEVGRFDTTPNDKVEFNGAWGVYPYLPSGNILVSDTETGLHILKPNYVQAAFLEGKIKDVSDNSLLYNAEIKIESSGKSEYSDVLGSYKTGFYLSGEVDLTIRKEGYFDLNTSVTLIQGQVVISDFMLERMDSNTEDELISDVKVYPNPFKNFLQVDYSFEDALQSRAELIMSNVNGQIIYTSDLPASQGSLIIDKELNPGIYFVQLFNGTKQSKALRVVKE